MTKAIVMTPEQCRAARAILKWSTEILSKKAGISSRTIYLFESTSEGARGFRDATLSILLETFRQAGVTFDCDDNSISVRLTTAPASKDPERSVSAGWSAAAVVGSAA
ncbi:XRE family transcriptional regulator [Rhodopseudomonas palustris]|uniref:XRE family transcriptional regulator n=1 Tax=Rhodopseudomonas palustris TaxID=1076 RepID=UPI0022F041D1|nr:XRE family transcriptional regulator [Rhodopseudomonas palustris]WBU27521.1 XRE family transcriptional regulator [Rhodopseudomonas palustris]